MASNIVDGLIRDEKEAFLTTLLGFKSTVYPESSLKKIVGAVLEHHGEEIEKSVADDEIVKIMAKLNNDQKFHDSMRPMMKIWDEENTDLMSSIETVVNLVLAYEGPTRSPATITDKMKKSLQNATFQKSLLTIQHEFKPWEPMSSKLTTSIKTLVDKVEGNEYNSATESIKGLSQNKTFQNSMHTIQEQVMLQFLKLRQSIEAMVGRVLEVAEK